MAIANLSLGDDFLEPFHLHLAFLSVVWRYNVTKRVQQNISKLNAVNVKIGTDT